MPSKRSQAHSTSSTQKAGSCVGDRSPSDAFGDALGRSCGKFAPGRGPELWPCSQNIPSSKCCCLVDPMQHSPGADPSLASSRVAYDTEPSNRATKQASTQSTNQPTKQSNQNNQCANRPKQINPNMAAEHRRIPLRDVPQINIDRSFDAYMYRIHMCIYIYNAESF